MALSHVSPLIFLVLFSGKCISSYAQATSLDEPLPAPEGEIDGLMDNDESWGYLYLAGLGISIIGWLLSAILLGSLYKKRVEEYKLKKSVLTKFAFAMGAILGTSVVILLPKAFGVEIVKYSINDQEYYRTLTMDTEINSLILLSGFGFFFVVDLLLRHALIKPRPAKGATNDSIRIEEPAKHNVVPVVVGTGMTNTNANIVNNPTGNYNVLPNNDIIGNTNIVGQPGSYPQHNYGNPNVNANVGNANVPTDHDVNSKTDLRSKAFSLQGTRKQTVLILARQMLYNFFSSFAIGAAFGTRSNDICLSVSIAILIQEIPFEIADTILLYYSGMSKKNAILWNLVWNLIPVLIGLSAGRALAGIDLEAAAYVFAAAVGGLLYVAATNIMAAIVKERKGGMKATYVIAAIIGAGVMFAILQIEE